MLDRSHLGMMDIEARRNAFGRQVRSFEADLAIAELGGAPLRAVFIRAPWIAAHGEDVEILASVDGHAVAARQGDVVAVAFHPELGDDTRLHERFLASCNGARAADRRPRWRRAGVWRIGIAPRARCAAPRSHPQRCRWTTSPPARRGAKRITPRRIGCAGGVLE